MKDVIFIGNRLNALQDVGRYPELKLVGAYVLKDSPLHRKLGEIDLPPDVSVTVFELRDKRDVLAAIGASRFDVLLSNGCPFILPVGEMKRPHQIFLNIHPTLLPDLKGKTPLNGVFFTGRKALGATMHHIDEGIDTGRIIARSRVRVTRDLDQGLVYAISFRLERDVFNLGMRKLIGSGFAYKGLRQAGPGSYFNRTADLSKVDASSDDTGTILKTVKSFGIRTQGTSLAARGRSLLVFAAEEIVNPYLLESFMDSPPGEIVLEYDGKILLRTADGIVKLTDFVEAAAGAPGG